MDDYLDMLYPRLMLMHSLLAPTGTLYLHLDWHANAYARLLLDEIFGTDRLLNEIIWTYHGPSPIKSAFNRKHDTILAYTKTKNYIFNVDEIREPYNPNTIKTFRSSKKAGFGKVPNLERGKVPSAVRELQPPRLLSWDGASSLVMPNGGLYIQPISG